MEILALEQVKSLFSISSFDEIEQFMATIAADSNRWRWNPLGGRENNSGSVNLAMDSGQALVERVTNAMDAHIELQFCLAGSPPGIESPRAAVQRLWNLASARLSRESPSVAKFIDDMAPRNSICVVGTMRRGNSSVIFHDSGIGQHPEDLPKTILGLQESNKNDKKYLMGAFGQGGSSTFAYCPYSLIISRRHPKCLDGKMDLVGWTIVRQFDDDSWKTFRYEYLVDANGIIPQIEPSTIADLGIDFEYGTKIVHIAYDLGRLNNMWSRVGYRFFDNLLFDPVLPYRIEDHRISNPFKRNLHGGRNRLEQVEAGRRPDAQTFETNLSRWGGEGTVHIRYWVFRPGIVGQDENEEDASVKLGSYLDYDKSPRTIIFTLNGQRHHNRDKSLVREASLGALADYLLVHVDCDGLSQRLKKEIFTATRAGAAVGERREDLIINAIREALADPWLKQKLDDILRRREATLTTDSTRRINQMLNKLITVYRQESSIGSRTGEKLEGAGTHGEDRKIHDPPRSLKFADHRRLELVAGEKTTIYLITDGPDDLFSRRRRQGNLVLSMEGDDIAGFHFNPNDMTNGRIPIQITVPVSVTSGLGGKMVATLEVTPDILLTDSRDIKIVLPPPPYVGIEPPTKFEFAKKTTMSVEVGRKTVAEIHTDARNDLLIRSIRPAHIYGSADIPIVYISVRGPRDGVARVEVNTDPDAMADIQGTVIANLVLWDGTALTATRPVRTAAAQHHDPSSGSQRAPIPAYQLKRVWERVPDEASNDIPWADLNNYDADRVGHWEPNPDALWLFVNMDERHFKIERLRWGRRFGDSTTERLVDRYVAYLAFHLFQLYDNARKVMKSPSDDLDTGNNHVDRTELLSQLGDPESMYVKQELQRVSSTLIQTLRSEVELARLQISANGKED